MANIYIDQYHDGFYRTVIQCKQGENLYEVLTRNGVTLPGAVCRGGGVCRGCQVSVAEEGMECLACRYTIASEELHISLERKLSEQSILLMEGVQNASILQNASEVQNISTLQNVSEFEKHSDTVKPKAADRHRNSDSKLGIAFDIGTTTIASALVNLESGELLSQIGCLNRQAEFGADVISRIRYASSANGTGNSGLLNMHECIKSDIEGLMRYYRSEGYSEDRIERLSFSGNTTMLHFLLHVSVNGMAAYPFTPERLGGERYRYENMEIIILPGKSAFVGGDIVSGVRYLNLGTHKEYDLLIDLGTNGELWLLNDAQGVCTSTSCGPAFANSVTKGNIHGTSLLDVLAEAYRDGIVDSTGLLQGEAFHTGISCGEIRITQETVRQIQLAKAAILTGIELAAYELRLPLEQIAHVYLAGGFGFYLNPDSAYCLGMFPEEFRGKVQMVGNTSLSGAIRALFHPEDMLTLPTVLQNSTVMDLSLNKNFQEFFLHRISFPKL